MFKDWREKKYNINLHTRKKAIRRKKKIHLIVEEEKDKSIKKQKQTKDPKTSYNRQQTTDNRQQTT